MTHVEKDSSVVSDVKIADSILTLRVSVWVKIAVTSRLFTISLTEQHNFFICQVRWNILALTLAMFVWNFDFFITWYISLRISLWSSKGVELIL